MRYILPYFLLLLVSCKELKPTEEPVAQVFEHVLYRSEIQDFLPKPISPDDSMALTQNYIRNWITQKLLLQKANENLSEKEKNVQKQVEDYRASLLIYKYKQKLIDQKLQENVSDAEMEAYYEKNQNNFVLSTPIVKATFFILPKNAPNLADVRKWFTTNTLESLEKLEEYCLSNARKYDDFDDNWVEAQALFRLLPQEPQASMAKMPVHIEQEDENNYYFLLINDFIKEQNIAPLDYVRDEIALILKNKKKLAFENELERQINEEGIQKKYVKIY